MSSSTLKSPELEVAVPHLKDPVDASSLSHRDLLRGEFWREIPAYGGVSEPQFLDHLWQAKNSITTPKKLLAAISGLVSEAFIEDVRQGFEHSPMSVRVSPRSTNTRVMGM